MRLGMIGPATTRASGGRSRHPLGRGLGIDAFDRLEPRDVPATLVFGGSLAAQVQDLDVAKSGIAPLVGNSNGIQGLTGATDASVVYLIPPLPSATSVSTFIIARVSGSVGVVDAVVGTTGTGLAADVGQPVTVQILPGPGEKVGDVVRVTLKGKVDNEYRGDDAGSVDRAIAYQMGYTPPAGPATTLLAGSNASNHVGAPQANVANQTASFLAPIGASFAVSFRLEARNTTTAPISDVPYNGLASFPSIGLSMSAAPETPAVPPPVVVPPVVADPPRLASASVVKVSGAKASKQTVLRLTFSQAIDAATAEAAGNYSVAQVRLVRKGRHLVEKLKVIAPKTVHYDPATDSVDLTFKGKALFKAGAQITARAAIATPGGIHLAGDGSRPGTDATLRTKG